MTPDTAHPPDFGALNLRFLPAFDPDQVVHLSLQWSLLDEDRYGFILDLEGLKPSEGKPGLDSDWESGCYVGLKQARALHTWLGFMLAQIDSGVLESGGMP